LYLCNVQFSQQFFLSKRLFNISSSQQLISKLKTLQHSKQSRHVYTSQVCFVINYGLRSKPGPLLVRSPWCCARSYLPFSMLDQKTIILLYYDLPDKKKKVHKKSL